MDDRSKADALKHVDPTEARQAWKLGRMRYVLAISTGLAALALFLAWLMWWS